MDITVLSIEPISIVAVCIMIGTLVVAYFKKWMMTYALIIANVVIFILSLVFTEQTVFGNISVILWDLGFRPIYLSVEYSPQLYTLFTSMFVHSGFAHIFGNMLVFFFIGLAFEQRIGWKKFLIIYLLTGVCGTLTHSLLNLGSSTILIGASGAIFGIMGAFAFSYPRDEVVMPIPLGIIMVLRRIKVIYAVLIFAALETIIVWFDVPDNTAHFAHLGGLVSGVVLAALIVGSKRAGMKKSAGTIYYDSYAPPKIRKINFSNLKKLATNIEMKDMLNRIEKEDVPQVRDIWTDHFLEKTKCPKCGEKLSHFDNKIWCENCDFKTDY